MNTFYFLVLISLGYVATDLYLPSLPAISSDLHAQDAQVQMTLFSYMLSYSLSPLLFGPWSDRVGRKKVILIGMAISLLATLGCVLAPTVGWLITARFFQGIGLGAVLIASRSSVADLFTGKALAKQMALVAMLMPLVLAVAPLIGGILQEQFQWRAVFVFLVFYTLILAGFAALTPESLKQPSDKKISQMVSVYRSHWNNPLFFAFGLHFILPSFGMFAFFTVSPFLFQNVVGLSPVEYGSVSLYIGAAIILVGYANLRLVHYFSQIQLLCLGTGLLLLSGGALLCVHFWGTLTKWSLLIPSLIYFCCMPFSLANAAAKCMAVVHHHFGAATALLTTLQFLTGALGSLIFSMISDETVLPLAISFVAVGIGSGLSLQYACALEKRVLT